MGQAGHDQVENGSNVITFIAWGWPDAFVGTNESGIGNHVLIFQYTMHIGY